MQHFRKGISLLAITKNDLDAFHQFAEAKLASRGAESLHELVDIWEIESPPHQLHADNVAAVRAAVDDMQNGDTGRPAQQVVAELRTELAMLVTI